jgi:NAD(P)-dependent dehydrogenase (short-subunit alcohol dehydrogenase family)
MQGKTVVITGATSGLGRLAAVRLAEMGARIVIVGRDRGRVFASLQEVSRAGQGISHAAYVADMSLIADVKRVGAEIAAAEARIDVLINNAGAIFASRQVTTEGLELTFALNHMGYFVLTQCLLDRLRASAPARIVNTASGAHFGHHIDFDDLEMARGYRARTAYGRSKLANVLFTRELARRLAGTGVTANCLHPGFVATNFGHNNRGPFGVAVRIAMRLFAGKPQPGAATIVYLASDPAVAEVSGEYFYECRTARPSQEARDEATARRLWEESERIAGL